MADVLTGSCLCGQVRFEVTEPPVSASYCHCTRCQKRTGTAASPQAFCSACGTALWSVNPHTNEVSGVRMSAFDDDPGVRPSYRQFVDYAAEWEQIPDDGLPRYPEGIPPQPS